MQAFSLFSQRVNLELCVYAFRSITLLRLLFNTYSCSHFNTGVPDTHFISYTPEWSVIGLTTAISISLVTPLSPITRSDSSFISCATNSSKGRVSSTFSFVSPFQNNNGCTNGQKSAHGRNFVKMSLTDKNRTGMNCKHDSRSSERRSLVTAAL